MLADQQTVDPLRVVVGIECEATRLLQQFGEHGTGFDACQGGSDAVMDPVPEGEVIFWRSTVQIHLVGVLELRGIPVAGGEEQDNRGTCWDVDAS